VTAGCSSTDCSPTTCADKTAANHPLDGIKHWCNPVTPERLNPA
jgi:hypothetical protein